MPQERDRTSTLMRGISCTFTSQPRAGSAVGWHRLPRWSVEGDGPVHTVGHLLQVHGAGAPPELEIPACPLAAEHHVGLLLASGSQTGKDIDDSGADLLPADNELTPKSTPAQRDSTC